MAKNHNHPEPITPVPFPMGNDRDGNNVKDISGCPHPLEIERGHRVYHDSHEGYPSEKRQAPPDYVSEHIRRR